MIKRLVLALIFSFYANLLWAQENTQNADWQTWLAHRSILEWSLAGGGLVLVIFLIVFFTSPKTGTTYQNPTTKNDLVSKLPSKRGFEGGGASGTW